MGCGLGWGAGVGCGAGLVWGSVPDRPSWCCWNCYSSCCSNCSYPRNPTCSNRFCRNRTCSNRTYCRFIRVVLTRIVLAVVRLAGIAVIAVAVAAAAVVGFVGLVGIVRSFFRSDRNDFVDGDFRGLLFGQRLAFLHAIHVGDGIRLLDFAVFAFLPYRDFARLQVRVDDGLRAERHFLRAGLLTMCHAADAQNGRLAVLFDTDAILLAQRDAFGVKKWRQRAACRSAPPSFCRPR